MNHKFLLLFLACIISPFHCVSTVLGSPIVGGFEAGSHTYKYHVSLHRICLETRAYEYICGGTIIHEKYVLTAAHCFMLLEYDEVVQPMNLAEQQPKIIAGSYKREGPGIERDVNAVFIPEIYDHNPILDGDIAVVQLRDSLDVASHRTLEIMPLGEMPANEVNERAIFCGFGRYQHQFGHNAKVLSEINRFLPVMLLDESVCPQLFICAVTSDKLEIRTACDGDSGAGLIFKGKIVGVFFRGPATCDSNTEPMIFTRISRFRNQIVRAMNERANHSDMHVLRYHSTAHQSPIHQAGPSSPYNKASPDRRKKGGCFPKFFEKSLRKTKNIKMRMCL